MLRVRETRPTRIEVPRSGMVSGNPGEGSGSGLSCASYQAGSIHSSATQVNAAAAGEELLAAGAGAELDETGTSGAASGLGMLPVVKS